METHLFCKMIALILHEKISIPLSISMSGCFPLVSVMILPENLVRHLLMSPLSPWSVVLSGLDSFLLPTRFSSETTEKFLDGQRTSR